MAIFNSMEELRGQIHEDVLSAVTKDLYDICEQIVYDSIKRNVYSRAESSYYTRTNGLLNAIDIKDIYVSDKIIAFTIFINSQLIPAQSTLNRTLNPHADVWSNVQSQNTPFWIEHGTSGGLKPQDPAHYMLDAYREISEGNKLIEALMDSLKARGYNVRLTVR